MTKLAKISIIFTAFLAFHADASVVEFNKGRVTSVNEQFCFIKGVDNSDINIVAFTKNAGDQVASIEYQAPQGTQYCNDLYSLSSVFQDLNNIQYGEALEFYTLDNTINPNSYDDCTALGKDLCIQQNYAQKVASFALRTESSLLGSTGGDSYVASVAATTGETVDDFYPVLAAVLGILIAFVVLMYIIDLMVYDDDLLGKTKKLSKEVNEHADKTIESYKAWNRRLPDLFN